MKKESGFTLVEAILALFTGSLVLMAIYTAINSVQGSASRIENKVSAQQDTRSALELMAMEIQMASYNPYLRSNIWVGNVANRGIQVATANSILIEMDITDATGTNTDGDGVIDGPNEMISYNFDSINHCITRATNVGTVLGAAQPFLGATTANATTQTVWVVNDVAGIPVFRYYDGTGALIPNPSLGRYPDIREIEITLVTQTSNKDIGTGGQRQIVYTTSVIPRNHVPIHY